MQPDDSPIPDTVQELEESLPDTYIPGEVRKRGTCSQCGRPFPERACGPTHAIIKVTLEQEQAIERERGGQQ